MKISSGDPVPAIAEADATGEIDALYADIRRTLGVPVVNLIWRHLATFPGGLSWAWESLRPLYAGGTVAAQAATLQAGLEAPFLPGLSAPVISAAGLSDPDLAKIRMIQDSYERSNALNMVALSALLAQLEGRTETAAAPSSSIEEPPVTGEMPALLTLAEMAPDVATLVLDLNRIGDRDEILASMYRHLAHWPAYLALVHALLVPFAARGALEPLITKTIADGRRRGAEIADGLADPEPPDPAVQVQVQAALVKFIDEPIGKMIAIVPLLQKALPA